MKKSDLIDTIARSLYIKHGGTIRDHSKMVATKKIDKIQLAYWLYRLR